MRTAVVLPAPLGPSTPSTEPRGTSKSMPRSACTLPNDLFSASTRIAKWPSGLAMLTGAFCQQAVWPRPGDTHQQRALRCGVSLEAREHDGAGMAPPSPTATEVDE